MKKRNFLKRPYFFIILALVAGYTCLSPALTTSDSNMLEITITILRVLTGLLSISLTTVALMIIFKKNKKED